MTCITTTLTHNTAINLKTRNNLTKSKLATLLRHVKEGRETDKRKKEILPVLFG